MLKWLFRIIILAIVLAIAFALLVDTIAKELAETYLTRKLGSEVSIEKLEVCLSAPRIKVYNFVLYNPAHFGGSRFIEIPQATIEYDFRQALKQNIYLRLARIDCSKINLVSDNLNRLNIEDFIKNQPGAAQPTKTNGAMFFIEILNLSIGVVRWSNIENPSIVQEAPVNINNYIIKNLSSKDLTPQFFTNLLLQIMLQSGKVGIKDGKLIILQQNPTLPRQIK
ncbi:MAG: hypothetical protein ACP5T0_12935 [Verrucomicrobiia bacterium]